jgi:hypothetical protein
MNTKQSNSLNDVWNVFGNISLQFETFGFLLVFLLFGVVVLLPN